MSASEVRHFQSNSRQSFFLSHLKWALFLCALSTIAFGCEPKTAQNTDKSTAKSTPKDKKKTSPSKPDATQTPKKTDHLVTSTIFNVDLEDFEHAVRKQVIYAPTKAFRSGKWQIPSKYLQSPALQSRLLAVEVSQRLIAHEAKSRNIVVSDAEITQHIKDTWRLSRFEPKGVRMTDGTLLPIPMVKLGVSMDDIRQVARHNLLKDKLRDRLMTEFTPEHFWLAWSIDQNRVDALIVQLSNTPKSYELDTYVSKRAADIERHFKANASKYQIPKLVHLTILQASKGKADQLEKAQDEWHKGQPPAEIAKRYGLKLLPNQALLRAEDRAAFNSMVGKIGITKNGARGSYLWQVEKFTQPKAVELTSAKKREIGAELMRSRSTVPSVRQQAMNAQKILKTIVYKNGRATLESIERVKKALAKAGFRVIETGPFTKSPEGFIPKVGLAESVVPALFKLDMTSQPYLPSPLLSRQKVYMAALVDRQYADRKTYDKVKDAFIKTYLEKQKPQLVQTFLSLRRKKYDVRMNLRPLQVKYGKVQKR